VATILTPTIVTSAGAFFERLTHTAVLHKRAFKKQALFAKGPGLFILST
jgi:hypothetical protein